MIDLMKLMNHIINYQQIIKLDYMEKWKKAHLIGKHHVLNGLL